MTETKYRKMKRVQQPRRRQVLLMTDEQATALRDLLQQVLQENSNKHLARIWDALRGR